MPINEEEVKEIKDKLTNLEENDEKQNVRISDLEEDVANIKSDQMKTNEQLKYVIQSQQDFKELFIQNMNAMHQNMNQIIVNTVNNKAQVDVAEINNNTQLAITRENNKVGLYGKLLLVVAAFFSGSKASDIWIAVKEIFK